MVMNNSKTWKESTEKRKREKKVNNRERIGTRMPRSADRATNVLDSRPFDANSQYGYWRASPTEPARAKLTVPIRTASSHEATLDQRDSENNVNESKTSARPRWLAIRASIDNPPAQSSPVVSTQNSPQPSSRHSTVPSMAKCVHEWFATTPGGGRATRIRRRAMYIDYQQRVLASLWRRTCVRGIGERDEGTGTHPSCGAIIIGESDIPDLAQARQVRSRGPSQTGRERCRRLLCI
ncbi:uncharacterized protein BKA78DRAFT_324019 [Phyllosticta capitalensis]|uniref:uncharacterized protein n=1 Tax=Phyllosticta capitalensis TaxID=121624 RepID=UPI00312D3804